MKLYLTPSAEKHYKKLPIRFKNRVKKKLLFLEENPYSGKKLVGEFKGNYSLRVWPYRIIYLIQRKKEIWVISILHRQGVYKAK